MTESAEDFYARVLAATDSERRLPLGVEDVPGWDIFPYELESLRIKPLQPLADVEPPRPGENPSDCQCAAPDEPDAETRVWTDADFRVDLMEASTLPVSLVLSSVLHFDLIDLPPQLAAQMGQLLVVIAAAMEALPSVGRAQIGRFGDGGAHLHIFLTARPARMLQLVGSPLLDWEENLPMVPLAVLQDNARQIAVALVAHYGGRAGLLGDRA